LKQNRKIAAAATQFIVGQPSGVMRLNGHSEIESEEWRGIADDFKRDRLAPRPGSEHGGFLSAFARKRQTSIRNMICLQCVYAGYRLFTKQVPRQLISRSRTVRGVGCVQAESPRHTYVVI
jgi:hypothetical protein